MPSDDIVYLLGKEKLSPKESAKVARWFAEKIVMMDELPHDERGLGRSLLECESQGV